MAAQRSEARVRQNPGRQSTGVERGHRGAAKRHRLGHEAPAAPQEALPGLLHDLHDALFETLASHRFAHHHVELPGQLQPSRAGAHDLHPIGDTILPGQALDNRLKDGLALDRHHTPGAELGGEHPPDAAAGADVEDRVAGTHAGDQGPVKGPVAAGVGQQALMVEKHPLKNAGSGLATASDHYSTAGADTAALRPRSFVRRSR